MQTRQCTKCHKTKPLDEFCLDNRRPGGYSSHCKECRRSYYVKKPPVEPLKPGDSKRCTQCGKIKPVSGFSPDSRYRLGYKSGCRGCDRAQAKDWKARNKDHIREYNKRYRAEHPEKTQRLWAEWYKENREEHLKKRRKQSQTTYGRLYNCLRQALRREAYNNGDVSPEQILDMMERQTRCAYCQCLFMEENPPTIDHIVPLSRGGTHTIDNVVLACKSCNSRKSNRLLTEVSDMDLK